MHNENDSEMRKLRQLISSGNLRSLTQQSEAGERKTENIHNQQWLQWLLQDKICHKMTLENVALIENKEDIIYYGNVYTDRQKANK